jgi:hypothetical protein
MKIIFRFSILFNVLLAGGLALVILGKPRVVEVPAPVPRETEPSAPAAADAVPQVTSGTQAEEFRWAQLDSGNDYRTFIANLRAIGCPENTIADIVRGNVGRAFDWKRGQLRIDDSGLGPWSRSSEMYLIGSLLENPSTTATANSLPGVNGWPQGSAGSASQITAGVSPGNMISQNGNEVATAAGSSPYGQVAGSPSFFQGGNRAATDLAANQQPEVSSGNGNGNGLGPQTGTPGNFDPGNTPEPEATPDAGTSDDSSIPVDPSDPLGADDPYAKSAQDIQNDEINKYDNWFGAQVAANASGDLGIDLTEYDPN